MTALFKKDHKSVARP